MLPGRRSIGQRNGSDANSNEAVDRAEQMAHHRRMPFPAVVVVEVHTGVVCRSLEQVDGVPQPLKVTSPPHDLVLAQTVVGSDTTRLEMPLTVTASAVLAFPPGARGLGETLPTPRAPGEVVLTGHVTNVPGASAVPGTIRLGTPNRYNALRIFRALRG